VELELSMSFCSTNRLRASSGSSVVEHSNHHQKVKGSSPAIITDTEREKMAKKKKKV
jgi:hypothetical protein